ncbi:MAG: zinc dependent phospholipase C family protein [Clostridia bacterium]|nr:zinc dependent phospholipase C family protein [Clostridia bacterium]
MASFITHYYMGARVANALQEKSSAIIADNRNAYDIGCQGNDLLFYVFGKFRGYASLTHTKRTHALFKAMCDYVRASGRDDLRAYLYGYICHYALDAAIHPYVIYISGKHLPAFYPEHLHKSLHMLLEGGIDFIILRDYIGQDPKTYRAAEHFIPCDDKTCITVADMLYNCVDELYCVPVPYEKLSRMPVRMRRYQSIFENTKAMSYKGLLALGRLGGYPNYVYGFIKPKAEQATEDWMNISRRSYPCVTGGSRMINKTVEEIISDSVIAAIDIISAVDESIDNGADLPLSLFPTDFMGYAIDYSTASSN